MPKQIICQHCGRRVGINTRLKFGQCYCGSPECQRARRNLWEREKLRSDPSYHKKRKLAKSKWRKMKPLHEYQRDYRSLHPEYVERNREEQRKRNQKRNESVATQQIVKTDALFSRSLTGSGFYALFPCKNASGKNIVKTDALIVQLTRIQGGTRIIVTDTT